MNKLKIAINKDITPAISKASSVFLADGWENIEIDWKYEDVQAISSSYGIMPGVLKDGASKKLTENVSGVHSLILDFDKNIDVIDAVIAKVKKWKFDAFVLTSINHKKVADSSGIYYDRFRIWIPLKTRLKTKEQVRLLADFIIKNTLPDLLLDYSCTDINRFFYPTPGEVSYFHVSEEDQFLDPTDIPGIDVISGPGRPAKPHKPEKFKKAKISDDYFTPDDEVTLADGQVVKISTIEEKTQIFCPWCGKNPDRGNPGKTNAFINKNSINTYYISCSSEQRTRWQHPESIKYEDYMLFFNTTSGMVCEISLSGENPEIHNFKNEKDWKNYCYNNNLDPKMEVSLKRAKLIFECQEEYGLNTKKKTFNLYKEPETLKEARELNLPKNITRENYREELQKRCPLIDRVLFNVFGEELYWEWLNWVAYIAQFKQKTFTNWIISTVPGAGKGMIAERLLPAIFGAKSVVLQNGLRLTDKFNLIDAYAIFKIIDEAFVENNLGENNKRKEHLKSLVGNQTNTIEAKGVDSAILKSFTNYMLFSNRGALSFTLDKLDRRSFVVNNLESKKLSTEPDWLGRDLFEKKFDSEIPNFTKFLMQFVTDENAANEAKPTDAKISMQNASLEDIEMVTGLFHDREWEKLVELLVEYNVIGPDREAQVLSDMRHMDGMPSKYMKGLLTNVLGSNRLFMRKRITAMGVNITTTRDSLGHVIKIYRGITDSKSKKPLYTEKKS